MASDVGLESLVVSVKEKDQYQGSFDLAAWYQDSKRSWKNDIIEHSVRSPCPPFGGGGGSGTLQLGTYLGTIPKQGWFRVIQSRKLACVD